MATRCDLTDLPTDGCAHCRGITDAPEPLAVTVWINSRYAGRCAGCGKPYAEDARIGHSEDAGGWVGGCDRLCPFCRRVEDGDFDPVSPGTVSFVPLDPVTDGHRLFLPRAHVPDAMTFPKVTGDVFGAASAWAAQQGQPCNLITSVGVEATQSIRHLHIHYVPRRADDGLALPWTGQVRSGR